ncbi:phosphoheptose isomerase [Aliifodinibius sp. S!AR15-10]|uniref:phosphoheptose isomerase n=1 Tax=Aliifodinibius sp. S!AR15-10 TaxID=2950437 RepID=UPI00285B9B29|nr:phosphoheptose isomerase [Aliifodinibius sp. S!AR15-10]MDR8392293.1 phosphoheptose isomerase [Aliifodinibius sp. S!AR15-10]
MSTERTKQQVFEETEQQVKDLGFTIVDEDRERPWGGFFVIEEEQAQQFANTYFEEKPVDELKIAGRLSPKILIVEPGKRLSWQYHHRRAEIWKIIEGPVGIITSDTNQQGPLDTYKTGAQVRLKKGERHRLVGLDDWGVLAEIWQHTDINNPSNEDDIVRVQDDFGR